MAIPVLRACKLDFEGHSACSWACRPPVRHCCRPACSLLPASVAIILCSSVLVPDANADEGATLRLSYQLKDSAGRTQVDTSSLSIKLLLSYEAGATPPAGAQPADNILPDCSLDSLGSASGVGQCSVLLPRVLFPAAGSLAAKVQLRVVAG